MVFYEAVSATLGPITRPARPASRNRGTNVGLAFRLVPPLLFWRYSMTRKNTDEIIHPSQARFSGRFTRDLLDDFMYRGDPEADAATLALHEKRYDPDGSQLANLRALSRKGEPRAQAFFERAEHRPVWLNTEMIDHGQRVALSFTHHYGLSLMHSLFAGAVFGRATLVTNSTGRLGSDPSRRIRETGAFIGAILEPGGLEPGARGFDTAVRVRLLHGSIRSWIKKSPGFTEAYVGEPLDQTMLAMTLGLFDYLNLRSLCRLGVALSDDDLAAHHHLWRYVGWLLGIDEALLTESLQEESELWSALVAHQAFPEFFGESYLEIAVKTVGGIMNAGSIQENFIRNLFLYLSGGEWFGVKENLLPDPLLLAIRAGSFAVGTARQWIPGVAGILEERGSRSLANARSLADEHRFGVKIETDDGETREAIFQALSAGVRTRFPQAA